MSNNNGLFLAASVLVVTFCLGAGVYAETPATVEVRAVDQSPPSALLLIDGKLAEIGNIEIAGRSQQMMVWLRELEKLGWGTVQAGPTPDKTIFKTKTISLTFSKGQSIALVNSLAVQLPIESYLKDGKLMVPLSFVAKSLNYNYDLANMPVAKISTTPPPVSVKTNGIRGQVLYNGKPVSRIKVSLVDPDYNTVKGFQSVTDANGDYAFDSVPDGKYLAYVWVGYDKKYFANANYFNRVSEEIALSEGKIARLAPINLGKIVHPIRPKADQIVPSASKIVFEWTPCEGAATYSLTVTKLGSEEKLVSLETTKPKAELVTKKLLPGIVYVTDIEARDSDGRFLGGTVGSGGKMWTFSVMK